MNQTPTAAPRRRARRLPFTALCAASALSLALGCASGPAPESTGIPGFEPTVKTVQATATEKFFVLDSNDVAVASTDYSLLGGIFLLLDDAQLQYRRYLQTLPPRTAVALVVEPRDSLLMDSTVRAARAPVTIWERVQIPRDNAGNTLPIARFLVGSVRSKVARAWVLRADSGVGTQPVPDWVVAGVTQLITGFPRSAARSEQLKSQLADLVPLDSLARMPIPESAVPSGVASEGPIGTERRRDSRGRATPAQPRRLPRESLAALEAGSIIEFMWAREGRGIVKQLIDRGRRGEPLSAVIAGAVSLPHDVAGLEAAWKASLQPPPTPKKN